MMLTLKHQQWLAQHVGAFLLPGFRFFYRHKLLQPRYIILNITNQCNYACPFCFRQASSDRNPMSLPMAEILAEQFDHLRIRPHLHFFGGEPLLAETFCDLATFFNRKNYSLSLTTNGSLFHEQVNNPAIFRCFKSMRLSLNGIAHLDSLTKSIAWLRSEVCVGEFPRITLNVPMTKDFLCGGDALWRKVVDARAHQIVFSHLMFDDPDDHSEMIPAVKAFCAWLPKSKNVGIMPKAFNNKHLKRHYAAKNSPRHSGKCLFPFGALFVNPDGSVYPCDGFPHFLLGNVKTDPITDMYYSRKMSGFLKSVNENSNLSAHCPTCCHRIHT